MAVHDLTIKQGETFRLSMLYALPPTDGSTPTVDNVEPVDLTGCTARMQVREKYGAPVLLELTTENGGLSLRGTEGWIDVLMTHEQTDELGNRPGERPRPRVQPALYDLEVTFPSGDVKRVVEGQIAFRSNITREG
jgi:hypothetical protein